MNKASHFFYDYLATPVFMSILAAGIAVYSVNQEVDNYSYFTYAWAWPHANEHTREAIRAAMADGEMTRWESTKLFRIVLDDVKAVTTCPTGTECRAKTVEEARRTLLEAMTNG